MSREHSDKYKVVKVYKSTACRVTLERDLTRDEAIIIVNSFPNRANSMVTFTKQ